MLEVAVERVGGALGLLSRVPDLVASTMAVGGKPALIGLLDSSALDFEAGDTETGGQNHEVDLSLESARRLARGKENSLRVDCGPGLGKGTTERVE